MRNFFCNCAKCENCIIIVDGEKCSPVTIAKDVIRARLKAISTSTMNSSRTSHGQPYHVRPMRKERDIGFRTAYAYLVVEIPSESGRKKKNQGQEKLGTTKKILWRNAEITSKSRT